MAVAVCGGVDAVNQPGSRTDESQRDTFHTDRGSTSTANAFTTLCRQPGIRPSLGRDGSCFAHATAEAFPSSPEWEVLSLHESASGSRMVKPSTIRGNHQGTGVWRDFTVRWASVRTCDCPDGPATQH